MIKFSGKAPSLRWPFKKLGESQVIIVALHVDEKGEGKGKRGGGERKKKSGRK
jgi:hypothetical protein